MNNNMFNNNMINMQQLMQFKNMMEQQGNTNYQQIVQQLINSGQMNQQQFNQFRNIANQITGLNM